MFKYPLVAFCSLMACPGVIVAQLCRLNAQYEERTSVVILDWNMISHPAKTTYILLKSTDTKKWVEVVTEKLPRNYTNEDVFDYEDRVNKDQKYFYCINIIDANSKIIATSNTATVNSKSDKTPWIIYPNPVNEMLSLVYQGNNAIKGVINITVQDITGKVVTRFRAASTNKRIDIPAQQYRKGIYVVQIAILNEIVLKQEFVKN